MKHFIDYQFQDMILKIDEYQNQELFTTLPKPGFQSITVTQETYDLWKESYTNNKDKFAKFGINSFTGYVNAIMHGVITEPTLQIEAIKKFRDLKIE